MTVRTGAGVVSIEHPGSLGTVQDLGRPGWAHLGVPPSGAADPASLRLANRLVGNPEGAACLELTLGGAALRLDRPSWIALAGAPVPATAGRRAIAMNAPGRVAGRVEIGVPERGLRTYVAVRGGIVVPPVLGSAATDVLSELGPPVLAAGTRLPVGPAAGLPDPVTDVAPGRPLPEWPTLRVLPGPRDDWLTAGGLATLGATGYTVSPDSNRVALRLDGEPLERAEGELPSEGMVTGGVQVPPDGKPIVFLADHPTTGGYPVVAVLASADVPVAAQLRPGDRVRFRVAPARAP